MWSTSPCPTAPNVVAERCELYRQHLDRMHRASLVKRYFVLLDALGDDAPYSTDPHVVMQRSFFALDVALGAGWLHDTRAQTRNLLREPMGTRERRRGEDLKQVLFDLRKQFKMPDERRGRGPSKGNTNRRRRSTLPRVRRIK